MIYVPPSGPITSKVAIIGAKPGWEEAKGPRSGKPFVGPSGQLLWKLFPVSRDNCYTTNVSKIYDSLHPLPSLAEIKRNLPELRKELEETEANVFICLGNEALFSLTGKWGIDKYRGSILESILCPGRKVVAAWHPANILRTYERAYTLHFDLRRAYEQSKFPEIHRPRRRAIINPTYQTCISFLERLSSSVCIDIECPRYTPDVIYCLGIGDKSDEALCIPYLGGDNLSIKELGKITRLLDERFQKEWSVYGQNIGFDVWRLKAFGFSQFSIRFDTMLAHHLLWPESGLKRFKEELGKDNFSGGHDLAFISSIYSEEPYYKDLGQTWVTKEGINWEQLWRYNCLDVMVTIDAAKGLSAELEEFHQKEYFEEHILSLIGPVKRMENRGIPVHQPTLEAVKKRLKLELDVCQARLNKEIGWQINVKSTHDKQFLLYNQMDLSPVGKTKKGARSTDKNSILTLMYNSPHRSTLGLLLDTIERRTLISGFTNLPLAEDGRYRVNYLIHGTDSGRFSCVSPPGEDGAKGPQLQNQPKYIRKIFRAPTGHAFVEADLAKAEAMYVAYAAEDETLISIFSNPQRDFYSEWASEVLEKEVQKGMVEREAFKQATHAFHYGMGPKKYITVLRLKRIDIEDLYVKGIQNPQTKAKYILDSYAAKCPKIPEWQKRTIESVKKTRTLFSSFSRRRFFMGRLADIERVALSYDPQASVVGITNQAFRRLDERGWDIVLQVHDSLSILCPTDKVRECVRDMQTAFYHPITVHGRTFNIPIDIKVGPSWGELEDYHE